MATSSRGADTKSSGPHLFKKRKEKKIVGALQKDGNLLACHTVQVVYFIFKDTPELLADILHTSVMSPNFTPNASLTNVGLLATLWTGVIVQDEEMAQSCLET